MNMDKGVSDSPLYAKMVSDLCNVALDPPAGFTGAQWIKHLKHVRKDLAAHHALAVRAIGGDVRLVSDSSEERLEQKNPIVECDYDGCDIPPLVDSTCGAGSPVLTPVSTQSHVERIYGYKGIPVETCFAAVCRAAGFKVSSEATSVADLSSHVVAQLAGNRDVKVIFVAYDVDDRRNHIELVSSYTANAYCVVRPLTKLATQHYTFVCTTMQHFFNPGNEWANYKFYSQSGAFGAGIPENLGPDATSRPAAPPSVVNESAGGGGSNVSSGVVRSKKRVIPARASAINGPVQKNYRTTNAVMFNNADELFQDMISREFAQEIIEDLFDTWGLPSDQPEAMKYAEDLLWTFLISVTASNKADYNRVYEVPVKPVERHGETVSAIDADFAVFSRLLEAKHGITRRQFARGVADRMREFLRFEENQHLLPSIATRVGCETLLAHLAFDGSTHCTNMTSREVTFTKTLESRNLFERDDIVAQGASERLMQGFSGGIRSVATR